MFKKIYKAFEKMNDKLTYGEDVTQEEVENFLGIVAVLYATANADKIDIRESQVIALYKFNMSRALERPKRKKCRDIYYNYSEKVDEIELKKTTIKLSEALRYFPHSTNDLSEETKERLIDFTTQIIHADGIVTQAEKIIETRLNLYMEKGQVAIEEIEELERQDS